MVKPVDWNNISEEARSEIVEKTVKFRTSAALFAINTENNENTVTNDDGYKEELELHKALLAAANIPQVLEFTNPIALSRTLQGIGIIMSAQLANVYKKAYELYEQKVNSEVEELEESLGKFSPLWAGERLIPQEHPLLQALSEKGGEHIKMVGLSLSNLEAEANFIVDRDKLLSPEVQKIEEKFKEEELKLRPKNFQSGETGADEQTPPSFGR